MSCWWGHDVPSLSVMLVAWRCSFARFGWLLLPYRVVDLGTSCYSTIPAYLIYRFLFPATVRVVFELFFFFLLLVFGCSRQGCILGRLELLLFSSGFRKNNIGNECSLYIVVPTASAFSSRGIIC